MKISREWRQRCSQADAHPPHFVPLYVFPRLTDSGGADFAMKKVRNIIRRLYYYEEDEEENHHLRHRQAGQPLLTDHHREDCEACEVMRCPRPGRTKLREGLILDLSRESFFYMKVSLILKNLSETIVMNPS